MAADQSLEVVNTYNAQQLKRAAQAAPEVAPRKALAAGMTAPAPFFPDNNTLEWSTSLAPGETPAPLDVVNESETSNQRILFYAIGKLGPRLTATLYVRAGQKAIVHLPLGRYRVDVASSAVTMSWDVARSITAVTTLAFRLPADDQENDPINRLTLSNGGKTTFMRMRPLVIGSERQSSAQPEKRS